MLSITAAKKVATLQKEFRQFTTICIHMRKPTRSLSSRQGSMPLKPLAALFLFIFLAVGCIQAAGPALEIGERDPGTGPRASTGERYADYNIVTVLPRDAIQAIDDPKFLDVNEADQQYDDDELVLGVEFNGDARAYSIPMLSSHEIVNDTVGGVKIAVTW